ncbi:MAG: 6,7-dimethyl-8-ribityllumazine synthase [Paramuribaculum sp.]|nr:6,7-dimethyl-8-ribityllumazine synthase [Paramuribaculum sp.]
MSTSRPDFAPTALKDVKVAVITAQWNAKITHELEKGAVNRLSECGVTADNMLMVEVPGAVELTYAASRIITSRPDIEAVIVFGAVVRGDTPHFDYVCQSVTQGVTALNAQGSTPVIFGVLTVNSEQQALDRVGGPAGHKGIEAADTALAMISLKRSF